MFNENLLFVVTCSHRKYYVTFGHIISSPEPLGAQGELMVYHSSRSPSGVRRPSASVHHFQSSTSLKPLGHLKPNFMWSLLWKGERKFI